MSHPYPRIDRWALPESVYTATLAAVGPPGRLGNESGAFWLGERAVVATVLAVILPAGAGVEELPGQWRVSPEVFGAISRWAKPRRLTLLGIAHTHGRGVPRRLSWADRRQSVQVPGMLAVVIGDGGEERDHRLWGWYLYEEGDYRELSADERSARVEAQAEPGVEVWRADARGVWPVTAWAPARF